MVQISLTLLISLLISATSYSQSVPTCNNPNRMRLESSVNKVESQTSSDNPPVCTINISNNIPNLPKYRNYYFNSLGQIEISAENSPNKGSDYQNMFFQTYFIVPAKDKPAVQRFYTDGTVQMRLASGQDVIFDKGKTLQIPNCQITNYVAPGISESALDIHSCKGKIVIDLGIGQGKSNTSPGRLSQKSIMRDENGNSCEVANSILLRRVGYDTTPNFNTPENLCKIIDENCQNRLVFDRGVVCNSAARSAASTSTVKSAKTSVKKINTAK